MTELKQETSRAAERRPLVPKDIDPHTIITVRYGFQGRLVYRSKKTGERFVWDSFGAEQDMEIGELRNARNSNKKYFINNWFMFDEPWIVDYIGMSQYYKFAIAISDFDKLFEKPIAEIERAVSKLSDGSEKIHRISCEAVDCQWAASTQIRPLLLWRNCIGVELVEHDK